MRPGLQPVKADFSGLIRSAAAKYRIPEALLAALVEVESGGNPKAKSPKGALGLAQLMPRTAEALGVVDPTDPAQNLDGAARHLSTLLTKYRGNVSLALAAYNAGEGAVDSVKGVPNYPETVKYLQKIAAVMNRGGGQGDKPGRQSASAVSTPGSESALATATPYPNAMTRPVPSIDMTISRPREQWVPEGPAGGLSPNEPPPVTGIGGGVRQQATGDLMDQLVYSAYNQTQDSRTKDDYIGGGAEAPSGVTPVPTGYGVPDVGTPGSTQPSVASFYSGGTFPGATPGIGGLSRLFKPSGGRTFTDYTPSER